MKIFEKIRIFWKREKEDIKKNYIISAGVSDSDPERIVQACKNKSFTTVYIVWADKKTNDPYMIGFESKEDAEKYLNSMKKHLYSMGYVNIGIKRCNIQVGKND